MLSDFTTIILIFILFRLASSQFTTSHRTAAKFETLDSRPQPSRDDAASPISSHYARSMLCTTTYSNAGAMAEASAGAYVGADPYGTTSPGPAGCFIGEPNVGTPTPTSSKKTSGTRSSTSSTPTPTMTRSRSSTPVIMHTSMRPAVTAASSNGTIEQDISTDSGHRDLIIEVVCGGVAAGVLLAGFIWLTRNRWRSWQWFDEKHSPDCKVAPFSTTRAYPKHKYCSRLISPSNFWAPEDVFDQSTLDDRNAISPASPTALRPVEDLDLGTDGVTDTSRVWYSLTNPDPISTTTCGDAGRPHSTPPWIEEQGTDRARATVPTTSGEVSPLTLDGNQSSQPSASTSSLHPPPSGQNYIPYRTSSELEGPSSMSVPGTSIKDLSPTNRESTDDSRQSFNSIADVYRGLSKSSRDGKPPWAYPSPEEALAGRLPNLTPLNETME